MDQTLVNFALALATNELIHNAIEVKGMRNKLERLVAYMDKKQYKELPININTRAKSYGISILLFVLAVSILFGFYSLINIAPVTAIKVIILLLVASFFVTVVTVDKFHVDIERVTKRFRK